MIIQKERHHPIFYFAMLGILCLVFLLVFQVLSLVILASIKGGSFADNFFEIIFSAGSIDGMSVNSLKFVQIISMMGGFIIPAVIISKWSGSSSFGIYNLSRAPKFNTTFLGLLALICFLPLIGYSGWLNMKMTLPESWQWMEVWMKEMEEMSAGLIEKFLLNAGPIDLVVNFFMIAILPGFAEELVFRGGFQKLLHRTFKGFNLESFGGHFSVWFIAVIFSAIHMQFYGFLPRFILGVLLGYLFLYTRNLWYPIIAHLVFNGVQVIVAYFMPEQIINQDIESLEMPFYLPIISLLLGGTLLLYFIQNAQPEMESSTLEGPIEPTIEEFSYERS